jgi:hypothetical protein
MRETKIKIQRECGLHDGTRLQRNDRCAVMSRSSNALPGQLPADTAALGARIHG